MLHFQYGKIYIQSPTIWLFTLTRGDDPDQVGLLDAWGEELDDSKQSLAAIMMEMESFHTLEIHECKTDDDMESILSKCRKGLKKMDKERIREEILKIVRDERPDDEISVNTVFDNLEDFDSLDHVELVMLVEEELGIDIFDDQSDKIKTVQDLIDQAEISIERDDE